MSSKDRAVSAIDKQIGGDHYSMPIQVVEFCEKNELPYCASNVIKYVVRHGKKNGMEDLRKAKHYLEMIAEFTYNETL